MTRQAADEGGLWAACAEMEAVAPNALAPLLGRFEPAVTACYEAGVLAPTLAAERHGETDVSTAALFLKRALTDLRSTWLLIRAGYTPSAAAVGAAGIENALTVSVIAGSAERARALLNSGEGDVPWSPMELAKIRAERWIADGTVSSDADYQAAWREVYSAYKWLCKIKHPTLRAATHEAASTALRSAEYVVMAAPDLRDADDPVKSVILVTVTNHTKAAIIHFAESLECDKTQRAYARFVERIGSVEPLLTAAFEASRAPELPFTIKSEKIAREWHDIRATQNRDV